ncbi:MAG: hypothetical protein ACK4WH_07800 [Phycisphaerales bacterium]
MTTLGHISGGTTGQRERGRALTVAWEISPSAIRLAPVPEIAAMNGQAERIGRAVLEWRVEGEAASADLRLEIGEDDVVLTLVTGAYAAATRDGDWTHVEVDDRLTVSERGGVVAYARTSLLAGLLGLRGGVYELARD